MAILQVNQLKRPSLAEKANEEYLRTQARYPMLASPKLDGIRALVSKGHLRSRSMKLIPNEFCQSIFTLPKHEGLDGELIVGSPTHENVIDITKSGVMSMHGEPDVRLFVFDNWRLDGPFGARYNLLRQQVASIEDDRVKLVPHTLIHNFAELQVYEEKVVTRGYEGVILRALDAPYKQGRSTLKQGWMLKMKRFEDSEAEILDFVELQHNDNEAEVDERGYTKRSSHQENKRAGGVLGTFVVRDIHHGWLFEIGTGFSAEQRKNLWEGRKYLKGKLVKYKYFPVGMKDKPRHPVFLGFRDRRDM